MPMMNPRAVTAKAGRAKRIMPKIMAIIAYIRLAVDSLYLNRKMTPLTRTAMPTKRANVVIVAAGLERTKMLTIIIRMPISKFAQSKPDSMVNHLPFV
jgi:hypothetical protein